MTDLSENTGTLAEVLAKAYNDKYKDRKNISAKVVKQNWDISFTTMIQFLDTFEIDELKDKGLYVYAIKGVPPPHYPPDNNLLLDEEKSRDHESQFIYESFRKYFMRTEQRNIWFYANNLNNPVRKKFIEQKIK